MNDLFSTVFPLPQPSPAGEGASQRVPLAERLRPRMLVQVIGQEHLTGEGMPLYIAFGIRQATLDDFVGPAGCGQDHHCAIDGACV